MADGPVRSPARTRRPTQPRDAEITVGGRIPVGAVFHEGVEVAAAARTAADRVRRPAGAASLWRDAWTELRHNRLFVVAAGLIAVLMVMAAFPQLFTTFYPGNPDPRSCSLVNSLQRPSAQHWFGFDLQGCDYYTRTVYGARVSMVIGISVVGIAAAIAVVFGSLAGYYGGVLDAIVARITDVWLAVPVILGGVVAITALRNPDGHLVAGTLARLFGAIDRVTGAPGLGVVAFVLTILGWPTMLRLMRSSVVEKKEAHYVDAALALGASDLRIIVAHILPNAVAPVMAYATISVGLIIAAEATLSFLGIGLQLPAISWGLMIHAAQYRVLTAPHLVLFPGVLLTITVFSFVLMGDAIRDGLDPRLR
ncbi:MAG: ABC transporter permease [Actinomycetota bacterium]|nr:ABC transporter permease [Actinomycetota bacterium]